MKPNPTSRTHAAIERAEKLLQAMADAGFQRSATFDRVIEYAKALRDACPFRPLDRVVLAKTPIIDRSSGWWAHRHFLVKGRAGIVRECDYNTYYGHYSIFVEWDEQTWVDMHGVERAVDRPAVYMHRPEELAHTHTKRGMEMKLPPKDKIVHTICGSRPTDDLPTTVTLTPDETDPGGYEVNLDQGSIKDGDYTWIALSTEEARALAHWLLKELGA